MRGLFLRVRFPGSPKEGIKHRNNILSYLGNLQSLSGYLLQVKSLSPRYSVSSARIHREQLPRLQQRSATLSCLTWEERRENHSVCASKTAGPSPPRRRGGQFFPRGLDHTSSAES